MRTQDDTGNDHSLTDMLEKQAASTASKSASTKTNKEVSPAKADVAQKIKDPPRPLDLKPASKLNGPPVQERPEIVADLLRSGEFMIFAADAKSGKTWLGLMLAHAIASGLEPNAPAGPARWLNKEIKLHGPVIYLNFELNDATFERRLQEVCDTGDHPVYPQHLRYVSLRGSISPEIDTLTEQLQTDAKELPESARPLVIIFDSLYNTYGSLDENSNSEMARHMQSIIAITEKLKCAVIFLHHFNKSSGWAANDAARASGAHALHRAPDALVTGTILGPKDAQKMGVKLREDRIYMRITASVRSFKDTPPFIISKQRPKPKLETEPESKGEWRYKALSPAELDAMKVEAKDKTAAEKEAAKAKNLPTLKDETEFDAASKKILEIVAESQKQLKTGEIKTKVEAAGFDWSTGEKALKALAKARKRIEPNRKRKHGFYVLEDLMQTGVPQNAVEPKIGAEAGTAESKKITHEPTNTDTSDANSKR